MLSTRWGADNALISGVAIALVPSIEMIGCLLMRDFSMPDICNYPLRFTPVFRRYLWGGRRLATMLGKAIGAGDDYAESWELVDHGDGSKHRGGRGSGGIELA